MSDKSRPRLITACDSWHDISLRALSSGRWETRFFFSLTAGWDWTAETLTNYPAFCFVLFWMEGAESWPSWSSRLVIGCSCCSQTVCIHRDAAWLFPDILCDNAQIREQRRRHHILHGSRLGTGNRRGSAKTLENKTGSRQGFFLFVCLLIVLIDAIFFTLLSWRILQFLCVAELCSSPWNRKEKVF